MMALVATVLFTSAGVIMLENTLVDARLARLSRVTTDFSPTFLSYRISAMRRRPPNVLFLGDSVLWGFGVGADQTAVALLARSGCNCSNLAFKAGNPANYYALARLLQAAHVRPAITVIEINQKVLNAGDDSYKTLHPAVAALARSLLDDSDRAMLDLPHEDESLGARADKVLSGILRLYAMRADVREAVFGNASADKVHRPSQDELAGSYDLTPLNEQNVGVHFLAKTLALLRAQHLATLAFLTPTNHELLHDYINNAQYRANSEYLKRLLASHGARVIDLDATFPANEFFDFNHLTASGQQDLAEILHRQLAKQLPR
jgi:hypothetical protein